MVKISDALQKAARDFSFVLPDPDRPGALLAKCPDCGESTLSLMDGISGQIESLCRCHSYTNGVKAKRVLGLIPPEPTPKITPRVNSRPRQQVRTTPPPAGTGPAAAVVSVPGTRPCTAVGNGERFADEHSHHARYAQDAEMWFTFTGKVWEGGYIYVERLCKETIWGIFEETAKATDSDRKRELKSHWKKSAGGSGLREMLMMARSELTITTDMNAFDPDPWLFNCANATIDLRTGQAHAHTATDMITKSSPVNFNLEASCPLFDKFLERILPDASVRAYVLRALGYSLSGSVREQAMFDLFGDGANGKGVLVSIFQHIMGDYGTTIRADMLMAEKNGPNRGATPGLTALRGSRFCFVTEVSNDHRLDEAGVKALTGGDIVTARELYKAEVRFTPTFKLWMPTNSLPAIRGTDGGIWRRQRVIPFTVVIPEDERDLELGEKLKAEADGILAKIVRACLQWQEVGLNEPAAVLEAVAAYRGENDALRDFISDQCVTGPSFSVTQPALWQAYETWAEQCGHKAFHTSIKFNKEIANRGYTKGRSEAARMWYGIGLCSERNDRNDSFSENFPNVKTEDSTEFSKSYFSDKVVIPVIPVRNSEKLSGLSTSMMAMVEAAREFQAIPAGVKIVLGMEPLLETENFNARVIQYASSYETAQEDVTRQTMLGFLNLCLIAWERYRE